MRMHRDIDYRTFAHGAGKVVNYRANDIIFRENDPPQFMYIVLSGSVDIVSGDEVIETVHEGQALGIVSLIDNQLRVSTARARGNCELAAMDRRSFRYMVEEVPNFVWYVMNELTHRLRIVSAPH